MRMQGTAGPSCQGAPSFAKSDVMQRLLLCLKAAARGLQSSEVTETSSVRLQDFRAAVSFWKSLPSRGGVPCFSGFRRLHVHMASHGNYGTWLCAVTQLS